MVESEVKFILPLLLEKLQTEMKFKVALGQ